MKKMSFSYSSQPIMTINNSCRKGKIVLNPKFQRGYIWKNEFRDELIVSILYNYPIGNIILAKSDETLDVVDGQQRLKTIIYFIGDGNDAYVVRTKASVKKLKKVLEDYYNEYKNIISDIEKEDFKRILSKSTIAYSDLPSIVKDDFMSYNLNITTLASTETKNVVEYFKYVQNQETLKAGEIINSMYIYNTDLNELISSVSNKEVLMESIGFSVKRNEFDKHFINFIGVLNRKIPLNAQSKYIVDFAEKYTMEMNNEYVNRLVANLNVLSTIYENNGYEFATRINTRLLKILLSYFSFYEFESYRITDLLNALNYIESEIKYHNEEVIKRIAFIQERSRSFDDIKEAAENFSLLMDIGETHE